MKTTTRWSVAIAAAGILMSAGLSQAAADKCSFKRANEARKLAACYVKALSKEDLGGKQGFAERLAGKCLAKFEAKLAKIEVSPECQRSNVPVAVASAVVDDISKRCASALTESAKPHFDINMGCW